MWSEPVGEGAKRVTSGLSDIENLGEEEAAPTGAAPLIAWRAAVHRVTGAIALQADRWFLWSPVAFGAGCAVYLAADREPGWTTGVMLAAVLVAAALVARRRVRHRSVVILLSLCAFAACGFVAGKVRSALVAGPVAPDLGAVGVAGWVVDVTTPGTTGPRVVIAPTWIERLSANETPRRIRLTLRGQPPTPGTAVRLTALVGPPPQPASPGAYDFARNAWFDGVGGVGVALTEPRWTMFDPPDWPTRLAMSINKARWTLAKRIASKMSEGSAGLGAAMVTGHETWVSTETQDTLRDAGLAHIVSISGLHMAIVGGFAFFLARILIAAIPWLALRVPGKKAAAGFGIIAVLIYLVISGAPPPAERAAITAIVAFGAILADRRAISLHALALAALAVLIWQPEAVGEAGFQMSFAATAALVALAERWPKRAREINTPWPIRLVQNAVLWLGISLAVSFVAGLATGPFAIQHFNRVALYGLPANLITEPLSGLIIMPALALGAVLETIGIGGPFLAIAGFGIDAMNAAAAWFAQQPHAVLTVSSAPAIALPVAFFGILWLCLIRGWLRWIGLPAALAISLWPRPEAPVLWIASDGAAAAVRRDDTAVLMRPDTKLFAAQLWARRYGLELPADGEAAQAGVFSCTGQGCRAIYADYPRLSAWWTIRQPKPEALDALCASSDILVMKAKVNLPAACGKATILTPSDFKVGGAADIYANGRIVWAQPLRGKRPWTALTGTVE
jgi:competence protein ComEC